MFRMIELPKIGGAERGYLSFVEAQKELVPFPIMRAYFIYGAPDGATRGRHAHREVTQVFFCLNGICNFEIEEMPGKVESVWLDSPEVGVLIGPMVWHKMTFYDRCILLALASGYHDEQREYIRDRDEWESLV